MGITAKENVIRYVRERLPVTWAAVSDARRVIGQLANQGFDGLAATIGIEQAKLITQALAEHVILLTIQRDYAMAEGRPTPGDVLLLGDARRLVPKGGGQETNKQ